MLELQDLKDFSIHNWYKTFEHVSLQTKLIEIPTSLLEKLQEHEHESEIIESCTEDYRNTIKNAICQLHNKVFVKNNWHAPLDAKMFSFGNELKVTNINDLFLYLSTSNVISEDFSSNKGIPFYLALKPWKNIHPASEFRCIVINNILRGITPRDWPTFYAHFKTEATCIIDKLKEFYSENVSNRFPRQNYTFDVILPPTEEESIMIVDFGPLNNKTNLYAFSWQEILPLLNKEVPEDAPPVFRYLESDIGIMTKTDAIFKFANALN